MKTIIRSNGRLYSIRADRNKVFTPDEWNLFFSYLKRKQKITFDCLLNTGARINELINAKREDINFKNNEFILRVTKGNKPRIIKLSSQFSNRLKRYIQGLKKGDNLPILSIPASNIAMKIALRKAKIKDKEMFSVHNVRKTSETWLFSLNTNPFLLFNHFGHDPQDAFKRYIKNENYNLKDRYKIRKILGDLYTY